MQTTRSEAGTSTQSGNTIERFPPDNGVVHPLTNQPMVTLHADAVGRKEM
jgi:hypothetical protein